ncbi:MAG TPA: thiopeptide-type bacteriocin biosynthesis protein [Frankiaceae bacterium]|nr:thiopeptide-type bacteriocin biosynthesis protein [Frankiaceae bacterium]
MDWTSLHVFLPGGPAMEDACIADAVLPAVAGGDWFYVRYWEGGPHLRVRVRGAAPEVDRALREWAEPRGGRVEVIAYEPETARYGGPDGLALSESFFRESSEVAAAVVAKTPPGGDRTGIALDLLVAFFLASTKSPLDAVRLLRSYAGGLAYVTEGPPVDVGALAQAAEAEFLLRRDALRDRFATLTARLESVTEPAAMSEHWHVSVRELAAAYRDLAAAGRLGGEHPDRVLMSQLHMFHNRLGVLLPDEAYLSWLVSLIFARANPLDDFLADAPDAPDRAYHEASKMVAARPWDLGRPAVPETGGRWAAEWAVGAVSLPRGDGAALKGAELRDVLLARRSCYGRYDGELGVDEVSTLLQYAAGTSRVVRFPSPGEDPPLFGLRTYPSAGARYAVRIALVARNVTGLPPAVYAYDAGEHALRAVCAAPATEALLRTSPMFGAGGGPTIDAAGAPALLCLVGEHTFQREKYGIRAYRLLLLEAGHLAQNLALVATGLGLATVTLASFHDDALNQLVFADGVNESVLYVLPFARLGAGIVTAPPATTDPRETSL